MLSDPIHNGWTIARSALLTHQHRLNVTANNIANIDTPGYTRRDALLSTAPETPSSIYEVRDYSKGVGVRIADVVRAQSGMTANLLRQQGADTAGHETRAQALAQLEALLGDDGEYGLTGALDAFWGSWYDLSNQADSVATRNVVIQHGLDLTSQINRLDDRITSFEQQVIVGVPGAYSGQLPLAVDEFNRLTEELQGLNTRISYSLGSFEPSGLMDERDLLLQELSALAPVTVGSDYTVALDGQTIVSGNGDTRNTLDITDAGPPSTFEVGGAAVNLNSGRIAAWSDVFDISTGMRDRLDLLTVDLMNALNDIHNSDRNVDGDSYDLDGERCDWDFFVGANASDIAINPLIYDPSNPLGSDPHRIAAAATRHDAGPPPSANAGDGARALQIADLATESRAALNGATFSGYHTDGLSILGGMVQSEQALADDGAAIMETLKDALQAETGVNLDEELMDMMQAQRAFQAAARLMQTIDEMMITIIQR
jgi:flagellar hook-associated protein 1